MVALTCHSTLNGFESARQEFVPGLESWFLTCCSSGATLKERFSFPGGMVLMPVIWQPSKSSRLRRVMHGWSSTQRALRVTYSLRSSWSVEGWGVGSTQVRSFYCEGEHKCLKKVSHCCSPLVLCDAHALWSLVVLSVRP